MSSPTYELKYFAFIEKYLDKSNLYVYSRPEYYYVFRKLDARVAPRMIRIMPIAMALMIRRAGIKPSFFDELTRALEEAGTTTRYWDEVRREYHSTIYERNVGIYHLSIIQSMDMQVFREAMSVSRIVADQELFIDMSKTRSMNMENFD